MTVEPPPRRGSTSFRPPRFLAAVVAAAVANALVFGIALLADASMTIPGPPEMPIGLAIVVVATLVPLLVAGVVCYFLIRAFPRLGRWLPLAGLIVAVASAAAPLTQAADLPTGIALAVMHVVAGVAWFLGARRSSADR
jgi:hypothetical protein